MNDLVEQVIAEVRERETHWGSHLQRRRDITNLVNGRWENVYPDDVGGEDLPMVANIFRVNIEDIGRLFAEQQPTQRVDRASERDGRRAEDREKVLLGYDNRSMLWDNVEYFGQDMAAVGFCAIRTWPRLAAPPQDRFPMHERMDPREILPEITWRPHRPTDNVIHDTEDSVDRLAQWFPAQMGDLMARITRYKASLATTYGTTEAPDYDEGLPSKLRVIDRYSSKSVCRVVCFDDGIYSDGEVLVELPNLTGLCPVQLAYRPSWSNEPIGQMDDIKGVVRAQNRYFRMLLDYFVEMVYGGKLVWNVKNPEMRGPGVRYYALGPDAKMDPITPEMPTPMALAVIQSLESEARSGAISPRSREGDVQLNKASAAFLERAQGQLVSVVKSLQRSFASAKQRANEVAFAQDETYCNATKELNGIARGRRFRVNYTPKDLIRGDYSNRVSYGIRGGFDQPTWNVLQLQKMQAGNLSRESFMEDDPGIEDVELELDRIRTQVVEDSLLQLLASEQLSPEQKLTAIAKMRSGTDFATIAQAVLAVAPATPPPGALPTAQGPVAASAGGAPVPPGAEGPLPPIAALRSIR